MPASPDGALTSASSPRTIDRRLWETPGPPGTEPPQQPPGRGKRRRPGHWGSFRLSREAVTQQSRPEPSGTPGGVSCTASGRRDKAELASVLCWVSMSHRLFPQRGPSPSHGGPSLSLASSCPHPSRLCMGWRAGGLWAERCRQLAENKTRFQANRVRAPVAKARPRGAGL